MNTKSVLISALNIKYTGRDTQNHEIDAQLLGESLIGYSKVYNKTLYLVENGKWPEKRAEYRLRIMAKPAQDGSYNVDFIAKIINGMMDLFPSIANSAVNNFVGCFVKSMWERSLGNKKESDGMAMKAMENAQELAKLAIGGLVASNERMMEIISQGAIENRGAFRQMVAPIGFSCERMAQSINGGTIIDAGVYEAEILRQDDEEKIEDTKEYLCKIIGVDTKTKSCRVSLLEEHNVITAKITDPVLGHVGNIYTHALYEGINLIVHAKAVMHEGMVQKLYIHHAEKV